MNEVACPFPKYKEKKSSEAPTPNHAQVAPFANQCSYGLNSPMPNGFRMAQLR
jgi:hypothetical protein